MSSRRNYLDADNSIMERNLRFVKNDFEENLNQYFGGGARSGNNVPAPPREYKVVQPKPGGSHAHDPSSSGLEERRGFLLQLGIARHDAYELAKNMNFDVNRFKQNYYECLDRGMCHDEIISRTLCAIRNQKHWMENSTHQDHNISRETAPFYEEQPAILDLHRHEYGDRKNGARLNSRRYQASHKEQLARSITPNRDLYEREREENFFSRHINDRDNVRNEIIRERSLSRSYSPTRIVRRVENIKTLRLHSPNRDRMNEVHMSEYDNFCDERERNDSRRRSRSCSTARSRSPNRNISEDYRPSPYSGPINNRREHGYISRSRSPDRWFVPTENKRHGATHLQHDNFETNRRHSIRDYSLSPPQNDRREEHDHFPRTLSSNRLFENKKSMEIEIYDNFRDNIHREERRHLSRSRSPNLRSEIIQNKWDDKTYFQHDNFREQIRRNSLSPPKKNHRQQYYQLSRSPSPSRSFMGRKQEEFHSESDDIRHKERRSRGYSPHINDHRKRASLRQKGPNDTRISNQQSQNTQKQNIPSLLTLDVFPKKTRPAETSLQNQNIPSLMSLKIFPEPNNMHKSSIISKKPINPIIYYQKHDNKIPEPEDNQNQGKVAYKGKAQAPKKTNVAQTETVLRQNFADVPVIKSGLKKPAPGHLKANPWDYWSQWWLRYKYIEKSIPKINPNDYEVKSRLYYLFEPNSPESRKCSDLLLKKGVKAIMKTVDIDETNYYLRDIFRLFQSKKHLEDPNFQNTLTPQQLNCIAPALRQFKIKPTMAFLHQALIVKWHTSLDIIKKVHAGEPILSANARNLLNDKSFNYFVMESIRELKKMCQQDWPQFNEFYKNIKAKEVDIYSFGVGPDVRVQPNKLRTVANRNF